MPIANARPDTPQSIAPIASPAPVSTRSHGSAPASTPSMIVFISVACGAGNLPRTEFVGAAEQHDGRRDGPAGERRADQLPELLPRRRGADQPAGLEVLRDVAGLARRDRDDRADGEHAGARAGVDPAGGGEDRGRAEQRHQRDAGGRLRRHADDADDARRHGDEQHAEDADAAGEDRALRRPSSRRRRRRGPGLPSAPRPRRRRRRSWRAGRGRCAPSRRSPGRRCPACRAPPR